MPPRFNSLGIDYKAVFRGTNSRMLLGQVKKVHKKDQSRKVECFKLSLDPKLLIYWNARKQFRSFDPSDTTKLGDIVLIKQLPVPKGHLITHEIEEVVYHVGATVDPMTGQLCHGTDYAANVPNPQFDERWRNKDSSLADEGTAV